MRAGERASDVELELASNDPTDLDDMVFSDEEESREVVTTSAVHRDPTAMSTGEEQEATRCVWRFLRRGSERLARTPLASERRSGRSHRASRRCRRSCCRLWRTRLR